MTFDRDDPNLTINIHRLKGYNGTKLIEGFIDEGFRQMEILPRCHSDKDYKT